MRFGNIFRTTHVTNKLKHFTKVILDQPPKNSHMIAHLLLEIRAVEYLPILMSNP